MIFKTFFFVVFTSFLFLAPSLFVFAQGGLVPCDGSNCDFNALITLVQNIINFLLLVAAPIAAIMFAWAGFLYLSARGNSGQISKAHDIFWNVLWGLVIALAAWLIINTITNALLKNSGASLLGG